MEFVRGVVERPGARISYLDTGGAAPVVVFLHGLAGSAGEFVPSARALWPDYRCVLVDQRGHGHSSRVLAGTGRQAFIDDVVAVLDVVSPGQSVVLVGQSMGAHTAVLTASAHPHRMAGMVLLEADVHDGEPGEAAAVGECFRSWPAPFHSRAEATAFLGTTALARAWGAELEPTDAGYRPRFDAAVMEAVLEAMHVPRWAEWAVVRAPTTVVFAADSMFTAARKDAFVAARPGTRRIDLSGGTHEAHLDAADEWIAVLRESLRAMS